MSKRILIIDDDKDMLDMLNIVFQDSEFEILLSNTGLNQDEIKILHPDLILIDVNIKGANFRGDSICSTLKTNKETAEVPVFLVSGEKDLDLIARDCHADGFFSKPFNINTLKSTVFDRLK